MQIRKRLVGDVTVLDLAGRLILDDGFEPLRVALNEEIGNERWKLLLNFQDVTHLDSAGLGLIACKYVTLCRHKGQLRLCNLQERTHRVLDTTKLLTVFKPFASEAEALESFE